LKKKVDLDLIRKIHHIMLNSSTNETKYLFPPREGTSNGPHTSEYTPSKLVALIGM